MGRDNEEEDQEGYIPLFETKQAKGRFIKRIWEISMLVGICLILLYRATHLVEEARWAWIVLFVGEIWFSFYWILTQALRWNLVYRSTFKDRLLSRHGNNLPKVDIFVCTANPIIEPPIMVINTVLSVMAYNYPPEKLSIYLSDDGGSILTFYALFEASIFSKHWLPYCRKYGIEPRAPAAYFSSLSKPLDASHSSLASIKKLYDEMKERIETSTKLGWVPLEVCAHHKGFSEWSDTYTCKHDHDTILQILIDGRNVEAKDVEGIQLPTLVYLAREKRPQHFHNFKAGAMNALIRVSSEISNGPIILNVDCDMYSNNSKCILDAICFFKDERKSRDIAYVQSPQKFENVTKNDIYGASIQVTYEVELAGMDGFGGPCYIGTGCFHRRDVLCGKKYTKEYKIDWKTQNTSKVDGAVHELEERAKALASSTYELNSQWGKEMGLRYGCAVEDVMTGLVIHCRGWKSVYLNPKRSAFLGVATTTLADTLVQHKRWSEGDFQIILNHCPFWYGHNKISLGHQLAYSVYCFWAPTSLATFPYCFIPSLYMLKGISLFPHISSPWFLPFVYIIISKYTYSLVEFLSSGGTILGWWNEQRIWLYKRTSSYLFAMIDMILKIIRFSDMKFVITTKVVDEDVSQRYNKEIMEFGVPSPMFTILTSLALINLFALVVMMTKVLTLDAYDGQELFQRFVLQILLNGVLVMINIPIFEAVFVRKDKGKMPSSVTIKATLVALLACTLFYR